MLTIFPQRRLRAALSRRLARWLALLVLAVAPAAQVAQAAPPMAELVQAELIAEPAAVSPGQPFWVALRLHMKEGWHVYWRNPGDSGEAPTIKWQLPPGFEARPIAWPTPERIPVAHLVNFGYERETLLLAQVTPPVTVHAGAPVTLKADVTWLVCEKECIPGEASPSLSLPVAGAGSAPAADPQTRAAFAAARAALPRASPWPARMAVAPEWLTLTVDAKGLKPEAVRSAFYFPFAETLVQHAAPQQLQVTADGLVLRIKRSALSVTEPTDAGGVLILEEALGATAVRQTIELANVTIALARASHEAASLARILQAAALALLGGIVLNLMPCVFPVLTIKVLSLIEQAGQSQSEVRRHGLAYTLGVLAAFMALGLVLIGVRAAGTEVGWGFQLQSPVTVAVLAYILFAMGLSLSGVFHVGSSVQGIGHSLMQRAGLAGSFFTGGLAAAVATPCTAPFMATALGFAFTQPAPIALAVILALGLGLALPFLLLTLAPQLISRLPRPGAWMETLKQALAFPIYATVAWLIWVLAQQVDQAGLLAALIGLVLLALAAWSFNAAQSAGTWGRRIASGTVAASLLATLVTVASLGEGGAGPSSSAGLTATAHAAERFSQRRLDELRAAGRPVFVNMTAAWCITCLVNEHAVLATDGVKAAFAKKNVAYLKGDWTNHDAEISRVLEKHGRGGVPLYLIYTGAGEPVVLPQILTPAIVLGEIDRIGDQPQRRASVSIDNQE